MSEKMRCPMMNQQNADGLPYVIIRSYRTGAFAGFLESRDGSEVVLRESRRLWRWEGAASLSQLSQEGVSKPGGCQFPCVVPMHTILEVTEILIATEQARQSIESVPVWGA